MSIGLVNHLNMSASSVVVNLASLGLMTFAVVHSWRSANRVMRKNRPRTRAWRIFVVLAFCLVTNGVILPFGAAYALVAYKVPAKSSTWVV